MASFVRFQFTAILYREDTTYLLVWATGGGWTLDRIETPDRSIVTELFRQFIGFAYSIIEARPEIRDFEGIADPGDPLRMRFYTKATEVIARRLHATSVIRPFPYITEFRITLPENTVVHCTHRWWFTALVQALFGYVPASFSEVTPGLAWGLVGWVVLSLAGGVGVAVLFGEGSMARERTTWSPINKAPVHPKRFWNRTSMGPT